MGLMQSGYGRKDELKRDRIDWESGLRREGGRGHS